MTDHLAASANDLSFQLDPSGPLPLYQQLGEGLRQLVHSTTWPANCAIPSERELMRITGLSRMTVRQAIDGLTREGLLQRVHGRGTYIVPEQIDQDINGVFSFSDQIREQGHEVTTKILNASECLPTPDEAGMLRLNGDDPIYRFTRLRMIDNEPVVINYVRVPAHLAPGLLDHDLTQSFYAILTNVYHLPPIQSVDTLEAVAATRDTAQLLGIRTGAPLSLVRRLARTHGETPIELTEEYARPDRLRYRLQQWAFPLLDSGTKPV